MTKIYTKNTWADEVLAGAERYDIKDNAGVAIDTNVQINLVTAVATAGTDVDATKMNNLESGVDTLDTLLADRLLTVYTTGGTSTAFTLTTLAASALENGERWRVIFNATAGASPTLERDGLGAIALKHYNSAGAKVACGATTLISGMRSDVIYDGTDYIVLDILPPAYLAPRTGSTTSSATPTINADAVDMYLLTAQTVDITSFTTNLTGTPLEGQKLWIAITGTAARAITWGAKFEAGAVALPTTTVTTQRLDVGFVWNTVTSKWRCMASGSA